MQWIIDQNPSHIGSITAIAHLPADREPDMKLPQLTPTVDLPTHRNVAEHPHLLPTCSCGWHGGVRRNYSRRFMMSSDASRERVNRTLEKLRAEWEDHARTELSIAKILDALDDIRRSKARLDQSIRASRSPRSKLTWEKIGEIVGMTRQSAYLRWGAPAARRTLPRSPTS